MPDSEASRTVAWVPSRRGRYAPPVMFKVSCACPFGVSVMSETVPMLLPDTSTRSPGTIWLAFSKIALTL
jgi:hypothetical protein